MPGRRRVQKAKANLVEYRAVLRRVDLLRLQRLLAKVLAQEPGGPLAKLRLLRQQQRPREVDRRRNKMEGRLETAVRKEERSKGNDQRHRAEVFLRGKMVASLIGQLWPDRVAQLEQTKALVSKWSVVKIPERTGRALQMSPLGSKVAWGVDRQQHSSRKQELPRNDGLDRGWLVPCQEW